ncbi:MAG: ATP-binding protein [Bacteroidales bacterium]|nr:ATP-binding protein [Bacteroidales bacterium]
MIPRTIQQQIISKISDNKAILIIGPRQCGKTTLLKMIRDAIPDGIVWFNGDNPADSGLLENSPVERLKNLIGKNSIIIIDEAQEIQNIGKTVKLITDYIKNVCPIISGSSSFELSNEFNEPLTGRKYEFKLFPVSFSEMVKNTDLKTELQQLETRLVFGSYPEIVTKPGEEKRLLPLLTSSYLYKDIFKYGNIRKPTELEKIVQLLAWQVSNEVNISEIAQSAGTTSETVERYIDMLEKAFILFRLPAYARNLRNEIKKNKKIYFYDNGIRNAVIGNFSHLNNRNDAGALWENYLVSERIKLNSYSNFYGKGYFWRTQQQQEIDYIEEVDGKLSAYEFKWNPKKTGSFPKTFINNYLVKKTEVINKNNIEHFLLEL